MVLHTVLLRHVAVPPVRIAAQDGARVPEPGDAGAEGAAELAQTPELAEASGHGPQQDGASQPETHETMVKRPNADEERVRLHGFEDAALRGEHGSMDEGQRPPSERGRVRSRVVRDAMAAL